MPPVLSKTKHIVLERLKSLDEQLARVPKSFFDKDAYFILGLVAIFIFHYYPIFNKTFLMLWDAFDISYPSMVLLNDSFKEGIFPLWNPFMLSGEAMFARPMVFMYNISSLIIGLLPSTLNLYHCYMMILAVFILLGGIGMYCFLRSTKVIKPISFLGALIFLLTSNYSYIGQPAILASIAGAPWLLYFANKIIEKRKTISFILIAEFSLVSAFIMLESYFGGTLYNALLVLIFIVFKVWDEKIYQNRAELINIVLYLVASVVLVILLTGVYIFPVLENRSFYYTDLSDFKTPDPRLRGVVTNFNDFVPLVQNLYGFMGIFLTGRDFSIVWNKGLTYTLTLFFFLGMILSKKIRPVRFWIICSVLIFIYSLGHPGQIYTFVHYFIPLYKNIRFPLLTFYMIQVSLILVFCIIVGAIMRGEKKYNYSHDFDIFLYSSILVSILAFSLKSNYIVHGAVGVSLYFCIRSLNAGRYLHLSKVLFFLIIVFETLWFTGRPRSADNNRAKYADASFAARNKSVKSSTLARKLNTQKSFEFSSKDWLTSKELYNHGYSPGDEPRYWYVKGHDFTKLLLYTTTKLIPQKDFRREDFSDSNKYIEALMGQIPKVVEDGVVVESPIPGWAQAENKCQILNAWFAPNSIYAKVDAQSPCLLFVTDKYYPGWKVYVNGEETQLVKANIIFKGTYLGWGINTVEFKFSSDTFWYSAMVSITTFLFLIIVLIVLTVFNRSLFRK
ncbi:MAG: hypothetical protein ISR65_07690 [Bacteriovoracaceae bacterium]|nr:hypothetical protein [Bacteriovoracaceae bacterium]